MAGWADALELLDLSALPALNATLNGLATVLLIIGLALIRSGRERAHRRVMVSAFSVSCLFLALYVTHKVWRGFESTPFNAVGLPKLLYLIVLFTHVTLAMTVPVLAIALIQLGRRGRRAAHRRLARVAWPIWMYVSLTGVLIYVLLYPLNPPPLEAEVSREVWPFPAASSLDEPALNRLNASQPGGLVQTLSLRRPVGAGAASQGLGDLGGSSESRGPSTR